MKALLIALLMLGLASALAILPPSPINGTNLPFNSTVVFNWSTDNSSCSNSALFIMQNGTLWGNFTGLPCNASISLSNLTANDYSWQVGSNAETGPLRSFSVDFEDSQLGIIFITLILISFSLIYIGIEGDDTLMFEPGRISLFMLGILALIGAMFYAALTMAIPGGFADIAQLLVYAYWLISTVLVLFIVLRACIWLLNAIRGKKAQFQSPQPIKR